MTKLKVEQLREGMVLATDVQNTEQMLLLPAGCTLAQKHIGILQTWGITDVEVVATDGFVDTANPLTRLSPEEVARLTAEIKARFWQLDETSKVQMEIFQLIVRRAAQRVTREPTHP